jgi:hypothetical protein
MCVTLAGAGREADRKQLIVASGGFFPLSLSADSFPTIRPTATSNLIMRGGSSVRTNKTTGATECVSTSRGKFLP